MAHREQNLPVDLILVRHGQSEGNLYDEVDEHGCATGRTEEADALKRKLHGHQSSEWRLTDLGRHQAERAGRVLTEKVLARIGSFDKAYVSSYARAMETAACLGLPNLRFHVHIFLREKETVKEWGRSGVDLRAAFGWGGSSSINTFYGDATGLESPADLLIRIRLFLDHLQQQCSGQRVLVVCHAHVLRAFRILLTDVDPANYAKAWKLKLQNCAIEWYTRRDDEFAVHSHFRRLVVLALKDASALSANHSEANVTDAPIAVSGEKTGLTCVARPPDPPTAVPRHLPGVDRHRPFFLLPLAQPQRSVPAPSLVPAARSPTAVARSTSRLRRSGELHEAVRALPQSLNNSDHDALLSTEAAPAAKRAKLAGEAQVKRIGARHAVDVHVASGMVVGIGTGQTAEFALARLAERLQSGALERVSVVPTSEATRSELTRLRIPTASLDTHAILDVFIGSADAVDTHRNVIKGGKGALLREKLVQVGADRIQSGTHNRRKMRTQRALQKPPPMSPTEPLSTPLSRTN